MTFKGHPVFPSEWIRSTSDPSAPGPLNPIIESILSILFLPFLPPYILYLTVTHLIYPIPFQGWTLSRHISNRVERAKKLVTSPWLPEDPGEEFQWTIPSTTKAIYASSDCPVGVDVISVPPCSEDLRVGIAVCDGIKGQTRPMWILSPTEAAGKGTEVAKEGEKAVLHIHGGGFVRGHPLWSEFPLKVAQSTGVRLFSTAYRLTLTQSTSFPAPLLDILSAYIHLTQTFHFAPEDITLLGDSAGGHLVLLLTRYLSFLSQTYSPSTSNSTSLRSLALPGKIAMSSPWCDLSMCQPSYITNLPWDTLIRARLVTAVKSALRWYRPETKKDIWFSPVFAKKGDWEFLAQSGDKVNDSAQEKTGDRGVKVYVHYGGRELFEDEVETTINRMKEDGVDVWARRDDDGLHTSAVSEPKGSQELLKDLAEFVKA